jgi:hypothetical protein
VSPLQAIHSAVFHLFDYVRSAETKSGSLTMRRAHQQSSTTAVNVGSSAKVPLFPCSITSCSSGCNSDLVP